MSITREQWLKLWGYEDGTPEAEAAWTAKQAMTARTSGLTIIPDISSFKSPVDGSVISSRSSLAEHNKRNNVVQLGTDRIRREEQSVMPRAGHDIQRAIQSARG